ncbi:unnamed protein product [Adineta steineri]|uniref:CENP-V/GFA domain-containing protein n=1 Tax=Adineta steineri TaxID=433720 RepID=A0A819GSA9_9BILA|nr:unnamed protein product [Adineta steineri]CAF3891241.1 unnamed protein product [Adineta steineri]
MSFTTGKCLCGEITVSIPTETLNTSDLITMCHCKNCRQAGGSLESINIIIPESSVEINGQPKIYLDNNTDSGTPLQRAFCSNCGCPIYTATSNHPGIQVIKLGLFDKIPKPTMEGYCKSLPSWSKPIDGIKHFDASPSK